MTMEKYINAVGRKLNLPRDIKKRVLSDFRSSIAGRREDGLTDEDIIQELGTPKEIAADFNAQMKEFVYKKSPWRWVCLAFSLAGIAMIGYFGIMNWLADTLSRVIGRIANTGDAGYVGIIGGADGPTSVFVTVPADGVYQQMFLGLLLAVIGLVGFLVLRKCPPIPKEHTGKKKSTE